MTVQRDVVVKKLVGVQKPREEGLIIGYNGVLMSYLPVAFWNNFTDRIIKAVPPEKKAEVKADLVKSSQEYGYHTGHDIIASEVFRSIVEPMATEGPKDTLRGAFAVLTAGGWAKCGIVQIKENERMVVRVLDYYESEGEQGELRGFMMQGISAAFFDLAYGGSYPDGLGKSECTQVAGLECGDSFSEFVVTKKV